MHNFSTVDSCGNFALWPTTTVLPLQVVNGVYAVYIIYRGRVNRCRSVVLFNCMTDFTAACRHAFDRANGFVWFLTGWVKCLLKSFRKCRAVGTAWAVAKQRTTILCGHITRLQRSAALLGCNKILFVCCQLSYHYKEVQVVYQCKARLIFLFHYICCIRRIYVRYMMVESKLS